MIIKNSHIPQGDRLRVCWKEVVEEALAEHGHEWLDDEWLEFPMVPDEVFE